MNSLSDAISAVRDPPESARSLHIELRIIRSVLQTLDDGIKAGATPYPCVPDILDRLNVDFRALGKLVDNYQNPNVNPFKRTVNRVIWVLGTEQINMIIWR